jgi:hypothetical protein
MRDDVGIERLPHHLICEECGVESDDRAVGWEAHLGLEDDNTEVVACFCPECISDFEYEERG